MVDEQHTLLGEGDEKRKIEPRGYATANLWVRYLRAIYRRFDKTNQGLNLPKNPCDGIEFFPLPPRDKVITWDALKGVWAAIESCSPIRAACWKMLLLTGLRSNACSQLRWSEVDFKENVLKIPGKRMKSGKDFTLPLSKYVIQLLKDRKQHNAEDFGGDDNGYVFPTMDRDGQVRAIENISQQGYDAEGNKIRLLPGPQTLRRTFNSACLDPRVNIPEHHRFFLMNHALPGRNVNEKHYSGMMRGLEPYRESLETVTAEILKACGVRYDAPKPKTAMDESRLEALAALADKIGVDKLEALAAALLPDSQRKTG
jgi:hypothetical protein